MTGYASATLSLLGPLHLILELRYLSHELVQAILQIKALLLLLVSLLLGLLQLDVHHSKDLGVLLQVSNGFLRLDLAVLGRVRQPSHIILQFVICILELLQELCGLPLKIL